MFSDEQQFVVCFRNATRKHWVQRFLKDGFQHCFAIKTSPGGKFLIIVDPIISYTSIDLLPNTPENVERLTESSTCVNVFATIDLKKNRGHICRINCVEIVKSLLGIKSFWTWTPYQLYKVLKNG